MDDLERDLRATLDHLAGGAAPSDGLVSRTLERSRQLRRNRRLIAASIAVITTLAVTVAATSVIASGAPARHLRVAIPPSIAGSSTSTTMTISTTTSVLPAPPTSSVSRVTTPRPGQGRANATPTTAVATGGPALLQATPAQNLPERGWVTVSGSGFPALQHVYVVECPADLPPGAGCDGIWWDGNEADFFTDGAGNLQTQPRPIRRVLADGTDCAAAAGRCELRLFWHSETQVLARTPLTFAGPSGPEIPMTLHVDPSTGLVDGQPVHVTGDYLMPGSEDLSECAANVCGVPQPVTITADGTLDATFTVEQTFSNGTSVDCLVDACSISLSSNPTVPISFASPASSTTTTTTSP